MDSKTWIQESKDALAKVRAEQTEAFGECKCETCEQIFVNIPHALKGLEELLAWLAGVVMYFPMWEVENLVRIINQLDTKPTLINKPTPLIASLLDRIQAVKGSVNPVRPPE